MKKIILTVLALIPIYAFADDQVSVLDANSIQLTKVQTKSVSKLISELGFEQINLKEVNNRIAVLKAQLQSVEDRFPNKDIEGVLVAQQASAEDNLGQ